MGFEPTRAEPIGLAVQRLNHSATSSDSCCVIFCGFSTFTLGAFAICDMIRVDFVSLARSKVFSWWFLKRCIRFNFEFSKSRIELFIYRILFIIVNSILIFINDDSCFKFWSVGIYNNMHTVAQFPCNHNTHVKHNIIDVHITMMLIAKLCFYV